MLLPRLVCSLELVVRRKTTCYQLPATNFKVKRGFSLIELLIVITIIAVLIGAGTVSWTNAQQKGRDAKRKSDLKAVQQALEVYFQTNGKYPDNSTPVAGSIRCNVGIAANINWGSAFICNSVNYLNLLPQDPTSQSTSGYYYVSSGTPPTPTSYVISADLENNNDPDRTGLPCTPYAGPPARDYCVISP